MAKSLLTKRSGDGSNISGYLHVLGGSGIVSTEARTGLYITEACTFSNLSLNTTATTALTFRLNGVSKSLAVSRTGAGTADDTSNTVSCTTGDLVNFSASSSNALYTHSLNVEFSSGYGGYLGRATNISTASTTLYRVYNDTISVPTSRGNLFPFYGYTSQTAFQVYVFSNSRTSTTTFANDINGATGSGSCVFASGATGRVVASGFSDAIGSGNKVGYSITTGAGTGSINADIVAGTFKSTNNAQDIIGIRDAIRLGFDATASRVRMDVKAELASPPFYLYKNGSQSSAGFSVTGTGAFQDSTHTVDYVAADTIKFDNYDWLIVTGSSTTQVAVSSLYAWCCGGTLTATVVNSGSINVTNLHTMYYPKLGA